MQKVKVFFAKKFNLMKIKLMIIGLFVFAFAFTSQAQTYRSRVVKKQVKQQHKVRKGVKSGALTKKETVKLQKQQRRIQKTKRIAKSDGVILPKEAIKINTLQYRANAAIYKKKHNKRARQ